MEAYVYPPSEKDFLKGEALRKQPGPGRKKTSSLQVTALKELGVSELWVVSDSSALSRVS